MNANKKIFLQVISSNPFDSATIEAHAGDRIQLVSALEIGGVTPSGVIVRKSLQAASIPTHVIVRHHNNGFVHTNSQIQLLLEDIIQLRDRFNVKGVVIGGLAQHGDQLLVDVKFMNLVLKQCGGKTKVTFHKASDYTTNLSQTIKLLSQMNIDEVLTQGSKDYILSAKSIQAVRQVQQNLKCKILAGGGINHANVKTIVHQWGIRRVHIGTCVRKEKFGAVDANSLIQFRQIIDKIE